MSLAHLLLDRPMQRRFESDPAFQATDLLAPGAHPDRRRRSFRTPPRSRWRTRAGGRRRGAPAGLHRSEHADPGSAAALQRPLHGDGHQRRRRLQPLARPGRHALARGRDARQLRLVLLSPRGVHRRGLVRRPTSRRSSARRATRRSSRNPAPSSAAATATSTRTRRSASRPRTTSSCAASRSPTAPRRRGRSRSPATRRSSSPRPRPTLPTRPSATCSCRRSSCATRQAILCTRRPRSAQETAAAACSTSWSVHGTAVGDDVVTKPIG